MQKCAASLVYLNVEECELNDLASARVWRALQQCSRLDTVIFRDNKLGKRGAVELAVLLAGSDIRAEPATALLLSEQPSKGKAAPEIKYVKAHTALVNLDISWNALLADGAKHLFQGLSGNASVQVPYVSCVICLC